MFRIGRQVLAANLKWLKKFPVNYSETGEIYYLVVEKRLNQVACWSSTIVLWFFIVSNRIIRKDTPISYFWARKDVSLDIAHHHDTPFSSSPPKVFHTKYGKNLFPYSIVESIWARAGALIALSCWCWYHSNRWATLLTKVTESAYIPPVAKTELFSLVFLSWRINMSIKNGHLLRPTLPHIQVKNFRGISWINTVSFTLTSISSNHTKIFPGNRQSGPVTRCWRGPVSWTDYFSINLFLPSVVSVGTKNNH